MSPSQPLAPWIVDSCIFGLHAVSGPNRFAAAIQRVAFLACDLSSAAGQLPLRTNCSIVSPAPAA